MSDFIVPPLDVKAGVLATYDLPVADDNFTLLYCRLDDLSGEWPREVDDTRHILEYGVQIRRRGGRRWEWAVRQVNVRFGDPCRDGKTVAETEQENYDPSIADKNFDPETHTPRFIPPIGGKQSALRFAILTDADWRVGAFIHTGKPLRTTQAEIFTGITSSARGR